MPIQYVAAKIHAFGQVLIKPKGVASLGPWARGAQACQRIATVDRHAAAMCPLLNGNEFTPQLVQGELSKATEELWLIRFTGQAFRDYECAPEPPVLIIAVSADLRKSLRLRERRAPPLSGSC